MFSDNEPSCLSAHLSFSVINVKEDSFLMVHITHVPGKFLPRNNLHLLSSVCLCGLFHSGVIYCSSISLALISHSSDWDVIFFSPPSYVCSVEIESVCGSACYLLSSTFPFLFSYLFICERVRLSSLWKASHCSSSDAHTNTKIYSPHCAVNMKHTKTQVR